MGALLALTLCLVQQPDQAKVDEAIKKGVDFLKSQKTEKGRPMEIALYVDTCFAILFLRRATKALDVATGDRK